MTIYQPTPPKPVTVRTDPKTGRMETVTGAHGVSEEDVKRTRRELRDMLDGNTPFHEDSNAAPKPIDQVFDSSWQALDGADLIGYADRVGFYSSPDGSMMCGFTAEGAMYKALERLHNALLSPLGKRAHSLYSQNVGIKGTRYTPAAAQGPGLYLDSGEFIPADEVNRDA